MDRVHDRVPRRLPRWSELSQLMTFRPLEPDGDRRRAARAANVADLRDVARGRVPRAVFDYVDGGADGEVSLRRSRDAYACAELRPRVLRDVSAVHTAQRMLGVDSAIPLVLAPTGFTRMMHHSGEPAVARAAAAAGVPYVLSTMGTTSIEDVAAAAPDGRRWFQLYLWRDRDRSQELIKRAAHAGYDTLVLTVDVPVGGARLRDVRNGMTIPPMLTARTVLDGSRHPAWWLNLLTTPPLEFASINNWSGTVADLADQLFDSAVTAVDLGWLREMWDGKLVVKGVQCAEDAVMAADNGADAVVVSNHGGRQLDRSPVPLQELPAVAAAVRDRLEVYVDGGVMTGADIAVALCSGAHGVFVGRAYLYGLMAAGETGVHRVLELLTDEFRRAMCLLGVTRPADLSADRIRFRNPGTE